MAVDEDALPPFAPKERQAARICSMMSAMSSSGKVIASDRNCDAASIRACRHLGKHRRLERAPPAAMNEHRERRFVVVFGRNRSMARRSEGP